MTVTRLITNEIKKRRRVNDRKISTSGIIASRHEFKPGSDTTIVRTRGRGFGKAREFSTKLLETGVLEVSEWVITFYFVRNVYDRYSSTL